MPSLKNLNYLSLLFISIFSLLFISCAHHKDVRPGVDGVHTVKVKSDDADEGSQDAIAQANHFCEERHLSAAFVNENSKYTGDMKEGDYKKMKTAGKVAATAGSMAYVFGGKKESNIGGLVGLGGVVANEVAGKGYTIEMKFKCL